MSSFSSKRPASAFVEGALRPSAPASRQFGENNHGEISREGCSDKLLYLFDKIVRGVQFEELRSMVEDVLDSDAPPPSSSGEGKASPTVTDLFTDLYLLTFQTRWSRGGKGERSAFYSLFNILLSKLPDVTLDLLELMPHYGYYKDLLLVVKECKVTNKINDDGVINRLEQKCYEIFKKQLFRDYEVFSAAATTKQEGNEAPDHATGGTSPQLTFAAKYAPSEGKEFDKLFQAAAKISKLMYPEMEASKAFKCYRNLVKELRQALDVPEIKECANRYSEIDFNRVTSLCLNRKMKAFLNEKAKTTRLDTKYAETGDRHPDNEDRVGGRMNLLKSLQSKGAIKGKDLFPHELVKQCMHKDVTTAEGSIMNAQWQAIREGVVKMIEDRKIELEEKVDIAQERITTGSNAAIDLGKVVCMSDVSGSMSGTPMEVSIAMGVLISEICHPAFRDLVLMFHENPSWHDLSSKTTFVDKVISLMQGSWGGSTNFEGAMNLIARVIEKEKLKQEDIPVLMVVSDMQFNSAASGDWNYDDQRNGRYGGNVWNTASENIKKLFHDLGVKMWGAPFDAPQIVFWNVRAGTTGMPATADEEGVITLSGYSPSLMKFVLSGEMADVVEDIVVDEETGEVTKVTRKITPAEALRKVLDDDGLELVRDALRGKDLSLPAQRNEEGVKE